MGECIGMIDIGKINSALVASVKSGNIDKEIGFEIFKIVNQYQEYVSNDIAIIGVACRFPKANSKQQFWSNIINKRDCISDFPQIRKNDVKSLVMDNQDFENLFCKAGYLDEIDKFDAAFFRISPTEAVKMDPWQRLFLQAAFEAVEDAGYGGDKLSGTKTGVFVGVDHKHRMKYIPKNTDMDFTSLIGNYDSIVSSRISYTMNLKGPSMIIDTACSSGLVAINTACKSMKNKECNMSIVGGINLLLFPDKTRNTINMMESQDDKLRPFDKNSAGSAWSEGVGAVLLKPLKKAIEDKDNIYAVIKGCVINNNGTSNGITSLNAGAQEELILKAWEEADINPESISYVEANATGSLLGDSIEVRGLSDAFKKHTNKKQFCGIGSVKANVGHMVSASGLASIIKVALALKYKQIPPTINFDNPNPFINFTDSAVYVNDKLKYWDSDNQARRAGVSSFGFTGTNIHMVLEEAPEIPVTENEANHNHIFTLSAKSHTSLMDIIKKFDEFLDYENEADISDICYTLGIGRGHYNYRLAIAAEDMEDLKQTLRIIIQFGLENTLSKKIYFGEHKTVSSAKKFRDQGEITEEIKRQLSTEINTKIKAINITSVDTYNEVLYQIGEAYIKGADIEWTAFYKASGRKKVSIPTYAFEKKRYWPEHGLGYLFDISVVEKDTQEVNNQSYKNENINTLSIIETSQKDIKKSIVVGNIIKKDPNTANIVIKGKKDNDYSEKEKELSHIWCGVLGFVEIDIYDNLFELGGDSVVALKLVNTINKVMNIRISAAEIMQYPSVVELAEYIDNNIGSLQAGSSDSYLIQKAEEREFYPLSTSQKAVFIMEEYNNLNTAYNIPQILIIEGQLDKDQLENAFKKLINRHEALRTSFENINGEPVQIVHKEVEFSISYKEADEADIEQRINDFIKPFDLKKPPLLRVELVKFSENKHLFLLDVHHIISDAETIMVLIKESMILYYNMELPELNIHYKDFALWQNNVMNEEFFLKQERYWLDCLKGELDITEIPSDYERPKIKSFQGDRITFDTGKELAASIHKLASKTNTTIFMLGLAVLNILISKYSATEDIIIGSPIMGRPNADLESVVGMFVNMLPIRSYPNKAKSFKEFLAEVKQSVLNAYKNQDYPFENIVKKLGIKRDFSRSPLFDISFSMQEVTTPEIRVNDLRLIPYENSQVNALFEILLFGTDENENISFKLDYCRDLFKRQTMESLARDFIRLLQTVVSNTEVKLEDLEIEYESKIVKQNTVDIDDLDFNLT